MCQRNRQRAQAARVIVGSASVELGVAVDSDVGLYFILPNLRVLAQDSDSPKISPLPKLHPHHRAVAIPRAVASPICTTAPGTTMRLTASKSLSEKCSPTPNISNMTSISERHRDISGIDRYPPASPDYPAGVSTFVTSLRSIPSMRTAAKKWRSNRSQTTAGATVGSNKAPI